MWDTNIVRGCEIPIITMQRTVTAAAAVTKSNEFGRGGFGSY
jgi:hypothetical protein